MFFFSIDFLFYLHKKYTFSDLLCLFTHTHIQMRANRSLTYNQNFCMLNTIYKDFIRLSSHEMTRAVTFLTAYEMFFNVICRIQKKFVSKISFAQNFKSNLPSPFFHFYVYFISHSKFFFLSESYFFSQNNHISST